MTLKKQFEQALREAEGGVDFPEERVERRLTKRIAELEWYVRWAVLAAATALVFAILAWGGHHR